MKIAAVEQMINKRAQNAALAIQRRARIWLARRKMKMTKTEKDALII